MSSKGYLHCGNTSLFSGATVVQVRPKSPTSHCKFRCVCRQTKMAPNPSNCQLRINHSYYRCRDAYFVCYFVLNLITRANWAKIRLFTYVKASNKPCFSISVNTFTATLLCYREFSSTVFSRLIHPSVSCFFCL